jgi:C-terminal processing protease CtpA/Prc
VEWPSPAFDAGLRVGDEVLFFGGKSIAEISRDKMIGLLMPKSAGPVTIEFFHLGKRKTVRLTPATYRSVLASMGRKWTADGPVPDDCVAD